MPTKPALNSITVWSALVVLIAQAAQLIGYTISADDQQAIANLLNSGVTVTTTIVSMVAAVGAIYGRVKATKQVVGVVKTPLPPGA